MKNLIIIIILCIAVYACDDSTVNNKTEKKISAKINGNDFIAENINIEVMLGPARKQLRIFGESGQLALELILKFEPMDSIRTGTYNLTKDGEFIGVYYHTGIRDTATEGTVILDKFIDGQNPIVKGSFNFMVKQNNTLQYSITNGIFDTQK